MKSLELFAGAGGLGLGVKQSGILPQLLLERDKYCCDTLRENSLNKKSCLGRVAVSECDVRDFDFEVIKGDIDLITGGPPCQPFSMGGKHRGQDDDRDMFPQAVRAVREIAPKAFIFENVKGLTRPKFSNYYEYTYLQLCYPEVVRDSNESWEEHLSKLEAFHTSKAERGLSYRVVRRVLNSANYGIPQKRERVFFVGVRADLNIKWNFPDETHSFNSLLWDMKSGAYWERHKVPKRLRYIDDRYNKLTEKSKLDNKLPWRTVRDAFTDLPDPELEPHLVQNIRNHGYQPGAKIYPGHTGSVLDMPSKTLKAGVHGVPGGENMLRRHDGSVRYFSIRESARLQTFPDDFVFHGSWSEVMRQLGNAVPVQLAKVVGEKLKNELVALEG